MSISKCGAFIGGFNLTVNNKNLGMFMNTFNLDSLINKPTCFQSANPNCIDSILTNKKSLFKNSNVLEVGISDHHSFITTALRTQLMKGNAKCIKIIKPLTLIFSKETFVRV